MISQEQRKLIEKTYRLISQDLEGFGAKFYENLFNLAPETRPMFVIDINEQQMKFMQTVGFAVANLQMPDILRPTIELLGKRHASYGVEPPQFEVVGEAMRATLREILGETVYTTEVDEAWMHLYQELETIALGAYPDETDEI